MILIRSKSLIHYLIFVGLFILIASMASAQSSAGVVRFDRRTDPSFNTYTNSPSLSLQQWMQQGLFLSFEPSSPIGHDRLP